MVVLTELILTVFTFGRCGSLERSGLDFNSFYFERVWQF